MNNDKNKLKLLKKIILPYILFTVSLVKRYLIRLSDVSTRPLDLREKIFGGQFGFFFLFFGLYIYRL